MLNSRDISLLRADVAANCRLFLNRCREAGWSVLITGTVRDEEFQLQCYKNGTSRSKVPTFHSVQAGLAFDVCKNVRGQEYSDSAFWSGISVIGKEMGFTWGGDWKSIVDMPHFQWDDGGRYTSSMIQAGKYPPEMPLWKEENMTQEQFHEMMEAYLAGLSSQEPSAWSKQAREFCEQQGIINGDEKGNRKYKKFVTREELAQILYNLEQA